MQVVPTPPVAAANPFYVGNREPLLPSPLVRLPIGSVEPRGWVRRQLELMADGFSGRLTEISPWCRIGDNAWSDPKREGKNGWEELPYWLRGFIDLGVLLRDDRIQAESKLWVEAALASQDADGWFGPASNREAPDLWPNMLMLYVLRTQFEATGDPRVLPFMLRYMRWQTTLPLERVLPGSWQKCRGADNLDTLYWLYNHTGEAWLLEAARANHERTLDWTGGVASWHGVNISECFRGPAQYYQKTHDVRYLRATERNWDAVTGLYGQVPGGLYGADENCRQGYGGPRQGTESCTMVEFMYSCELLTAITGQPLWADRCEEVAFNSLPCAMTPDLKGLHYLTAPNQVQLDRGSKAPMIQNGGDMFSYNPHDFRCCQHNMAFGWPYYAEHLWMATPGAGLAAVLYAESAVRARVGDGTEVTVEEATGYPFDEAVRFTVHSPKPVRFPLLLRIPRWCQAARVAVNGQPAAGEPKPLSWAVLEREWKDGDTVRLDLPMAVAVRTWEKNHHAVSVDRGPLTFSLKIGETWKRYGGTDAFPACEVFPATPWNYALVLDAKDPAASFRVVKAEGAPAPQPFTVEAAPIALRAKAKRVAEWQLEANGLVGAISDSPVAAADGPAEDVTLIPMGCARLRITAFPVAGEGPEAKRWQAPEPPPTASHCNPGDTLFALSDGSTPASSSDGSQPRFTWWDHQGTEEWVQYAFAKPRRVAWCEVYWFDDTGVGQCRVPQDWQVLVLRGDQWQPAEGASECGVRKDQFNRVTFSPVETTAVRVRVRLQPSFSGGVLEWRLGE